MGEWPRRGVLQVHRRISTPEALVWSEKTRGMYGGVYYDYAFGRLEDRFAFLVQGPRDMPERHQTLRAVCDWSYGLLDPREQAEEREEVRA